MAVYAELLFYTVNPSLVFSSTVGGFGNWTGASAPDGNATIFDNESGIEGQTLDDDSGGAETATADVYAPGGTSNGTTVDAEAVWTVRDTITNEIFEVVQFEVETGGAGGLYTLSEIPLVAGRSYETLDYDSDPNATAGDPVFSYLDYDYDAYSAYSVTAPSGTGTVDGTSGNDSIESGFLDPEGEGPTAGADIIIAGAGDDTIVSDGGADTLIGGTGGDRFEIDSGFGADSLVGGDDGSTDVVEAINNTSLTVTYSGDLAGTMTNGTDTLSFEGIEQLWLTNGGDSVDGSADTSGIFVSSRHGNDTLTGGSGNDTLNAGVGADSVTGGAGDDSIKADTGYDTVDGGAGNDTLSGGGGNDSLLGGADNDRLIGGTGNDSMDGGDDADLFILEDSFGNDTIIGGEGGTDDDTLDLSALTGAVTVTYGADDESGTITDGTDTITFSEVERLILTDQADSVDATAVYNGIFGDNPGIDVQTGDGNDTVASGWGGDTIDGGAGDDSLDGDYGDDSVLGGAGADTLIGSSGNDTLLGGDGADILDGGVEADTLEGGSDNDTLLGQAGDDSLSGDAGDDLLFGHGDDDTLSGGTGDDALTGGGGDDVFTYSVGDGHDTITDFNTGNTGTLSDGDSANNDFIDLTGYYDHISELYADQADDGILNQSNVLDGRGRTTDYSDNDQFGPGDSITFTGASADNSSFTAENTGVVCFSVGTLIATPTGETPVEDLRPGDLVLTADNGPRHLVHSIARNLGAMDLADHPNLRPILIKPGAFGVDRPLVVSPQHALLLEFEGEQHLIPAKHLARMQGGKVRVMQGCRRITYVHLLFEQHEAIFANGRATESFYPGPEALKAMSAEKKAELLALFPEFRHATSGVTSVWPQVRPIARRETTRPNCSLAGWQPSCVLA
ncbi:MAG: Hint domain-containing protein [Paracoccaceae bacterium]